MKFNDLVVNHTSLNQLNPNGSASEKATLVAMFPSVCHPVKFGSMGLLKELSTTDWIFHIKKYLPRFKELGYKAVDVRMWDYYYLPYKVIEEIAAQGFLQIEKPSPLDLDSSLNKSQYYVNYSCISEFSRYFCFSTEI